MNNEKKLNNELILNIEKYDDNGNELGLMMSCLSMMCLIKDKQSEDDQKRGMNRMNNNVPYLDWMVIIIKYLNENSI